jgi:hypothetical protein
MNFHSATFRRTKAIARKEMLHILRDSRSLTAALMQPVIMLLIFGWALSLDVDRIPTYVYDMSRSPESRDLIRAFQGSKYFSIKEQVHGYRPIDKAIDKRSALLAVVIPEDFAKKIGLKQPANVQLLLDGSDSNTAAIAQGYAEGVVAMYSQQLQTPIQTQSGGVVQPRSSFRQLHRARPGGGDRDDHRGESRLADHRPRMGKRNHGATALHSRAAERARAGKTVGVLRGRRH